MLNLLEAPENLNLKVIEICSGMESKRKLLSIGIRPEDIIVKLSSPTIGAILVRNQTTGSTRLAVGKGLAKKIEVQIEE